MYVMLFRCLLALPERCPLKGQKRWTEDSIRGRSQNFINDVKLMRAAIINAVEGNQGS